MKEEHGSHVSTVNPNDGQYAHFPPYIKQSSVMLVQDAADSSVGQRPTDWRIFPVEDIDDEVKEDFRAALNAAFEIIAAGRVTVLYGDEVERMLTDGQ